VNAALGSSFSNPLQKCSYNLVLVGFVEMLMVAHGHGQNLEETYRDISFAKS
jgi:hypothetical protein